MKNSIPQPIGNTPSRLTSQFIAGLIVILPLVLSIALILFLLKNLDNILGPIMARYIGMKIPGIGIAAIIVLIWFIGFLTTNFIGRRIVGFYESILHKIPIINTVFGGIKQISDTVFAENSRSFRTVALVNLKPVNMYTLGFLSGLEHSRFKTASGSRELLHVFIPNAPVPTSGFIFLVPVKDVYPLNITVEEGFKAVVSLGVVHPKEYFIKKLRKEKKK